jgi:hypothetical protein
LNNLANSLPPVRLQNVCWHGWIGQILANKQWLMCGMPLKPLAVVAGVNCVRALSAIKAKIYP